MNNTINGRTPEEIKKGLWCCSDYKLCCRENCPYYPIADCGIDLHIDTTALIQQLEERVVDLNKTSKQLEAERDAAVSDLENNKRCETCINYTPGYFCLGCRQGSNWQWRGVQEVE